MTPSTNKYAYTIGCWKLVSRTFPVDTARIVEKKIRLAYNFELYGIVPGKKAEVCPGVREIPQPVSVFCLISLSANRYSIRDSPWEKVEVCLGMRAIPQTVSVFCLFSLWANRSYVLQYSLIINWKCPGNQCAVFRYLTIFLHSDNLSCLAES